MADLVSSSQFSQKQNAAPTNGTQTAPTAPVPTPAPGDPLTEAKKFRDEAAALKESAEKRARTHEIERRKFADEKKGLGAKLSKLNELEKWKSEQEKLEMNAKLNKAAYLKAKFGDDWYDQVVAERLNGGAPTADTVALAIEQAQENMRKEFAEKAEKERAELQREQAEQLQTARTQILGEASAFLEKSAADYPIFEGTPRPQVAAALAQFIEQEFHRTGKVVTTKEAAEAIEASEIARAERLTGIEKYREKLTAKLKPVNASTAGAPQVGSRSTGSERRTLSNDLTATTPGPKRTARNDEERREAAFAAFEAARRKA